MSDASLHVQPAMPVRPRRPQRPDAPRVPGALPPDPRPLGRILLDRGAVDPGGMVRALALQGRERVRLGDILLAHGMVSDADLVAALCEQWKAGAPDIARDLPDSRLIDALGARTCLRYAILPWRRVGGAVVVLTARPEEFVRRRPMLEAMFGPVIMGLAREQDLHAGLLSTRRTDLRERAETRVAAALSCREWNEPALRRVAVAVLCVAAALFAAAPIALFALLVGWAVITVVATTMLKAAAAVAQLRAIRHARHADPLAAPPPTAIARLPVVSVMVPLFREPDIAPRLIARLGRLTYPKELLDVLLLVEEDDAETRTALAAVRLPHWMRVIAVPAGPIMTKPRALNFALDFCRGSIVGVYDAEDAPDPDQLHRVVRRFHERGPEVACVQGVLDYYNPRRNWLARCFTIEYASWFRIVLPGMARLGLVVPLGGTTLFFRRTVLDRLGGWDAHNVTEDADLGVRLARAGYRTELLDSVTGEEANCRLLPWVRQRSRWIKGYAMTWAVHMRSPRTLWRELGARRFWGMQIVFLGTLSQFFLAPVLWSFWLLVLGLPHPLAGILPGWAVAALVGLFLLAEAVNITIGLIAVSGRRHRFLRWWVPTMHLYYPLAVLAAFKAAWELARRPFYWDKTAHGAYHGTEAEEEHALTAA